jgi:hypothetical protein
VVPSIAAAIAAIAFGPRLSRTLSWRALLLGVVLGGAVWARQHLAIPPVLLLQEYHGLGSAVT